MCPNDGARLDEPEAPADLLIGTLLADRYRVIRTLGEGGMGRVYLAEHVRMGRLSAVKVMSPALAPTPDAISRFNREAANASQVNHPNVAAIYDFGETADGTLYLAMEYVEGETLAALVRRAGSLSLANAGELTRQIADALTAAHQRGIIHRDLKPDNILITRDADGRELVKLVDFGIAKTARGGGQTVTTVGMSIGTPEYMSPEQLAGEPLDVRTDIYSLGLVTFTMLTGQIPFPDPTSKQSLVHRLTTRPRSLRDVRPSTAWPERLQAALDRALSPEPADRHAKVGDFAMDVVAATGAASIDARTRRMTPLAVPTVAAPLPQLAPASRPSRLVYLVAGALLLAGGVAVVIAKGGLKSAPLPVADQSRVAADSTAVRVAPAVTTPAAPLAGRDAPAVSARPQVPPMPSRRQADSLRVAATSRSATHDTVVAAPAPAQAQASPAPAEPLRGIPANEPSPVARRARRHAWLGANGDSSGNLAAVPPVVSEAREVMGHVNRARHLFAANQPTKALPELRTGYEEYRVFAADHPGTREAQAIRNQLSAVTDAALADCPARPDTLAPADRRAMICAALAKAAAIASQDGAFGAPPFQPNRRRNRPPTTP